MKTLKEEMCAKVFSTQHHGGDVRKSFFHTASWRRCAQKFFPHSLVEEIWAKICSTQPHGGDVRKSFFHTDSWRRCVPTFIPHSLMEELYIDATFEDFFYT